MKKSKYEWDIEAINESDYELKITMHGDNSLLMHIFNMAKRRLKRIKNLDVRGNPDCIEQFEVPDNYLKTIKTAIRSQYLHINKTTSADGIALLNYDVSSTKFKRINDKWDIHILIRGMYSDNR